MIPRIKKLQIKNYKSLASVSVDLEPFTVFVGPNGSGKSNIMDALAFVQECLVGAPETAFTNRGGIGEVISRLDPRPALQLPGQSGFQDEYLRQVNENSLAASASLGFRVVLDLGNGLRADYSFSLVRVQPAHFLVERERCTVQDAKSETHEYEARNGKLIGEIEGVRPQLFPQRLALPLMSGLSVFTAVWRFLVSMRFYEIDPGKIRQPQQPDYSPLLDRDGANAAAFFAESRRLPAYEKLSDLMTRVVPGFKKLILRQDGTRQMLSFEQELGSHGPVYLDGLSMSDGTLRAVGVLLAAYQPGDLRVVGIEEPEATIHPALADVIMEALMDASHERQVLITTHSPDLLNYKELKDQQIRVVNWYEGRTIVAPLSSASRDAVREHLYMPGELLSVNELNLNLKQALEASESVDLFGPPFDGEGEHS